MIKYSSTGMMPEIAVSLSIIINAETSSINIDDPRKHGTLGPDKTQVSEGPRDNRKYEFVGGVKNFDSKPQILRLDSI